MKSAVSKQKKQVLSVLSAVIVLTVLCLGQPAFSYPRDRVEGNMILINDNGGWCWYQDDKIIYDPVGGNILTSTAACWVGFGGVGGDRYNDMDATTFNIATGKRTRVIAREGYGGDDHNMGAFWIRPDGRYMHFYCAHYTYPARTYYRVSTNPNDGSAWGSEQYYDWSTISGISGGGNLTYTNVHYITGEGTGNGRLYNIVRWNNVTPNISYSDDLGATWDYMGRLNSPAAAGYSNYYHKFRSNGVDRIDFIGCEQHPRNYNNSIYHGYIQGGKSYNSYGVEIDDDLYDQDAPSIQEYTPIFIADAIQGPDSYHTGWTNEIELDKDGYPVCLYQTRYGTEAWGNGSGQATIGAADHRFFYARFDGVSWTSTELGKMGVGLHLPEQDYIGMGCIHPNDANIVYISTPFDPRDDTEYENHEIFKGVTPDRGLTWDWTQLTFDSTEWNVRPAIPSWDANNTAVVWTRGNWNQDSYEQYDLVVVGLVEQEGVTLGPVTYIDANTSNTTESGGSPFTPTGPSGSAGAADNEWHEYTGYGNGGSCYTAGDGGPENAPAIKTTISGLADGTYDVFAYMWCDPNANWGIRGGFESSDMLCFSKQSSQHAEASQFAGSVDVLDTGVALYRVYIGRKEIGGGGSIDVYLDNYDSYYLGDVPTHTMYDGVGVALVIFEDVDIIYVDASATSGGDGHSWGTAYKYLQDALDAAGSGDKIRVAEGIYKPDEDEAGNVTPGDRYETFQLINGVAIYGGFPASGGSWQDRDPNIYEAILSGDLNGDDVDVNDPCDLLNEPTRAENSYHVVTGSGTNATAVLDGFTITAGNANGGSDPYDRGGGINNYYGSPTVATCTFSRNSADSGGVMYNNSSSPTITNCTFSGNSAKYGGGVMNNWNKSSPTLTNCTFNDNSAGWGGGGMCNVLESSPTITNCMFSGNSAGWGGGGIDNYDKCNPTLVNCTFSNNSAEWGGGGMSNWDESSPTLTNCTFNGNSAGLAGGGMMNNDKSSPVLTNCTFSGNSVSSDDYGGGGMFNYDNSSPTITNCTFTKNSAVNGGGGMYNRLNGGPTITNCILWGNTAADGNEIALYESSTINVNYCDVQGGQGNIYNDSSGTVNWGTGNIDDDPCFVALGSNDYHLQLDSPCIDAGDNTAVPAWVTTDLDGNRRIRGPAVDMGAYESPAVVFVDVDAASANDGSSWEDAYNYLQDALSVEWWVDEIRVAEGIYKPDEDTTHPDGSGNRAATFQLKTGMVIKGGYAGFGEPDPDARDIELYETILSGDLNGNDGPDFANNGENSYHVVTGSETDETAVLDGFTITAGNANGPDQYAQNLGGGMFNLQSSSTLTNCAFIANSADYAGGMFNYYNSNPTLTNCTFSDNSADYLGGGMFNYNSSPTLTNCTFSGSSADEGAGMFNYGSSPMLTNCTFSDNSASSWAGGIENYYYSSPTLTNCTFSDNSGNGYGGGIQNWEGSNPTLTNCTFSGNSAYFGGAMDNFVDSSPTLTNCIFSGNSAEDGGGIYNYYQSSPTLTNCTFSENSAENGGGIYNYHKSSPMLTNCILWDNTAPTGPQIYNDGTSSPTVSYSDVQGGWPGTDNINANPCFVNPDSNDFHLLPDSPCIDAGDNTAVPAGITTDLDGKPRFVDDPCTPDTGNGMPPIVDMGAYEANYIEVAMKFTPQALNPKNKGKWAKAHFVLPEGFLPEDVDTNTPAVIALLGIESDHMNVFINEDGLVEIEAAFSRYDFCRSATTNDAMELTVIGRFTNRQYFYGTDTIRIIDNSLGYVAVLAAHWLKTDCSKPDWCSGADLDQDTVVNFVDFALFDGCCIEVVKE